jgi:hypothetical protein
VSQWVWHVKEPSLLKAVSAKHRSKFAALSLVIVTVTRYLKNCSCDSKQTNKTNKQAEKLKHFKIINEIYSNHKLNLPSKPQGGPQTPCLDWLPHQSTPNYAPAGDKLIHIRKNLERDI